MSTGPRERKEAEEREYYQMLKTENAQLKQDINKLKRKIREMQEDIARLSGDNQESARWMF